MLASAGGILLGWSLGSNDACNIFGTAVGTRVITWRRAALLSALFVVLGAVLQGQKGLHTLANLTQSRSSASTAAVFAAGATVVIMTLARLPVSTSQAVVGALLGAALFEGHPRVEGLDKVVACWFGTPLGAMAAYVILHFLFRWLVLLFRPSAFTLDAFLRVGLVVCGCYGAYALGANNVGNVAVFVAQTAGISGFAATVIGGGSIALGILTFSKPLMIAVGRSIVELNSFTAFVVVLAEAVTVHLYAMLGVPVSTSQAVVGALVGVGLLKGLHIVYWHAMIRILFGWVGTPALAAGFAFLIRYLLEA